MQFKEFGFLLCAVVCAYVGPIAAETTVPAKRHGWFTRLEATKTTLLATFPNEGIRYHLWINEVDQGVSRYDQVVELKFGDTLMMQDKHFTCVLQARSSSEFSGLVGSCDGNLRGEKVFRTVALPAESGEQK